MPLTAGEKIKVLLGRRGMTIGQLAARLGVTGPNISNKIRRDDFGEKELREIAKVLECTYEAVFVMTDSQEKI